MQISDHQSHPMISEKTLRFRLDSIRLRLDWQQILVSTKHPSKLASWQFIHKKPWKRWTKSRESRWLTLSFDSRHPKFPKFFLNHWILKGKISSFKNDVKHCRLWLLKNRLESNSTVSTRLEFWSFGQQSSGSVTVPLGLQYVRLHCSRYVFYLKNFPYKKWKYGQQNWKYDKGHTSWPPMSQGCRVRGLDPLLD